MTPAHLTDSPDATCTEQLGRAGARRLKAVQSHSRACGLSTGGWGNPARVSSSSGPLKNRHHLQRHGAIVLCSPPSGTEITRFASWSLRRTIRSAGAPHRDDAPVGLRASPRALKEKAESSQNLSVTAQRRSQSAARLIQQGRIASARTHPA